MTSGAGTPPDQQPTTPPALIAAARARAAQLYPHGMTDDQIGRINAVLRDAQERAAQQHQQAT